MLCLWLASPAARSQAPTVSYTGGSSTANGAAAVSYGPTTDPFAGYGGGAGGHGPAGYYTKSSGAIQATLTWPKGVLPTAVIVQEHCTAKWNSDGDAKQTGGDDCALPNPTVVNFGPYKGESHEGYRYTGYSSPAANTLALPAISPSASATGVEADGDLGDSIAYAVTAYPITISLTGTTPDASGNANILVGQGCTAKLSGIPSGFTASNWQWSVSGTTFQSWSPITLANPNAKPPILANSQASSYAGGCGGTPTSSSIHWYWNDPNNTTETVSCAVTLTPPAGQGNTFTVTAIKTVKVQLPTFDGGGLGGYMQVNALVPKQSDPQLWAGPTATMKTNNANGGMNWQCYVYTPTMPAFGTGSMELIQIVTPSSSYMSQVAPPAIAQTYTNPLSGVRGLDLTYPYGSGSEASQPYNDNDSPGLHITQMAHGVAGSATFQSNYIDYLMYMPPSAGNGTQWIALAQFTWNTNGSAAIPTTKNWADYAKQNNGSDAAGTVGPSTYTKFTGVMGPAFFPMWTTIDGKVSF